MPKTVADAPRVTEDLVFYWEGFNDLHSTRTIGMEEGPIPWTAIKDYAVYYDLPRSESEFFKQVIRLVDRAYLRIIRENRERNKN